MGRLDIQRMLPGGAEVVIKIFLYPLIKSYCPPIVPCLLPQAAWPLPWYPESSPLFSN